MKPPRVAANSLTPNSHRQLARAGCYERRDRRKNRPGFREGRAYTNVLDASRKVAVSQPTFSSLQSVHSHLWLADDAALYWARPVGCGNQAHFPAPRERTASKSTR